MCSAGIAILWYYRASSHCKHEMGSLSWSNVKKVPSPLFVRCSSHGCSLQDYIILQAQDLDCVIVTMYDHVLTSCILTVQPNALSTYKSSLPGEHATSVWFLLPSSRQNDVGRDYVERVCKVMGYKMVHGLRSKHDSLQCSIAPDCGYKRRSTDREALHAYTQPEGIGYLVRSVFYGQLNYANFWTKSDHPND